jgi:hypothetical protein
VVPLHNDLQSHPAERRRLQPQQQHIRGGRADREGRGALAVGEGTRVRPRKRQNLRVVRQKNTRAVCFARSQRCTWYFDLS